MTERGEGRLTSPDPETFAMTGRVQGSFQVTLSQSPFHVTQPTIPFAGHIRCARNATWAVI